MSSSCDKAIILRQIICSLPKSVVNGDWRKVFYNGITGNDRAARAEPSWLEFCRVVKEEDESQINGITEIEFRAICALAFSVLLSNLWSLIKTYLCSRIPGSPPHGGVRGGSLFLCMYPFHPSNPCSFFFFSNNLVFDLYHSKIEFYLCFCR